MMQRRRAMTTKVQTTIPLDAEGGELHYQAAAPCDYRLAFAGSGLPFPTKRAAMEDTPNRGVVRGQPGTSVTIEVQYPNAYRDGEAGVVDPSIDFAWKSGGTWVRETHPLGPRVPHRSLTYHPLRVALGPMFYAGTHELEVRNQERVLRESSYPLNMTMPADSWGTRPRL